MAVSGAQAATTGQGSNIDVAGIVGKLMTVEQKPLAALNAKEASYQAKISAFGQVKSALSAFQSAVQSLSNTSKFQSNTVTSSDANAVSASVTGSAAVGTHSIEVKNLAVGERLSTEGLASDTAAVGKGVITFDLGTVNGETFNQSAGQFRAVALNNAELKNGHIEAKTGEALPAALASFTPAAKQTGLIPAGTLTVNNVKVGEIALDGVHNAKHIAAAFDAAYVASGGQPGLFSADAKGNIVKRADAGKPVVFGRVGEDETAESASKNTANLVRSTGLTSSQLGSPALSYARVTVPSTAGLTVGDAISGGGLPEGSTIAAVVDGTHFIASAAGDESKNVTLHSSSTSGSQTVTIDSGNDSLQGIRDAINAAKIGVTASIVNDGSATPYRLLLSSDGIGANNRIKINVNGDAALADLLDQDPVGERNLTEVTVAKDASVVIDGIPVSKSVNTLTDVVQGMTVNLHQVTNGATTLTVSHDTAGVQASIEGFVKAFNDLSKIVTDLTVYNQATKKGAALQGDSAMRSLESQLSMILTTPLSMSAGSLTTLSQIGISKPVKGGLTIDAGKLSNAINTQFNDVAGLFSAIGKTSDPMVSYKTNTATTAPGDYAVEVSALATQGRVVGDVNLVRYSTPIEAGTTIKAEVDGTSAAVDLVAGVYNPTKMAEMIQNAINSNPVLASAGRSVTASIDNDGHLNILSNIYGSKSSVKLSDESGTSVERFMGSADRFQGRDIVGSIDGQSAIGKGQVLVSDSGPSAGLEVQVSGGALGDRGTIRYTQGYAYKFADFANKAMANNGLLSGRMDGLASSTRNLSKERDTINARLVTVEDRYRRQYSKLDSMISNMNGTSNYLSQQLAKL